MPLAPLTGGDVFLFGIGIAGLLLWRQWRQYLFENPQGTAWFDDPELVKRRALEWGHMNRQQFLMTEGTAVYETAYAHWGPMPREQEPPWPGMPNDDCDPHTPWVPKGGPPVPPY